MNCQLTHNEFRSDGIFGVMTSEFGAFKCVTIEHAFEQPDGSWQPKLQPGTYTCQRRLSPHFGVDVFEIINVAGCTYIEIHPGNWDRDTDGCVCPGEALAPSNLGQMVTASDQTFATFMGLQAGVNTFTLVVT
jgi:Family of unknown function (DUF5675)